MTPPPTDPTAALRTDEDVARLFHEAYERLAPEFGYRTREASAKPWEDVPIANRLLMEATVRAVRAALATSHADDPNNTPDYARGYVDAMDNSLDYRSQADDPSDRFQRAMKVARTFRDERDAAEARQADDPSGPDVEAAWAAMEMDPERFETPVAVMQRHRPIIEAAIRAQADR